MRHTQFWPSRLTHLWPLALLGVLVCIWYAPQLTSGTLQFDAIDVHYSAQRYLSDALSRGRLPTWTPYLFTGFPFLSDLQVGAWYPLNWPFLAIGITPRAISGELLLHTLIACAGAYALAMRLIGQPTGAFVAAMLYGLSGWFAAHSQHVGMFQTAAWLPWLVLALDTLRKRLDRRGLVLAAMLGGALALPGHFQVALYAFSGAVLWALLESAWARSLVMVRRTILAGAAVSLGGALLSAVMILPAAMLVLESDRVRFDARNVDLGYFQIDDLLTLLQPDHYGLLSGQYGGPGDVTQHYLYAGVLLLPLAVLGAQAAPLRKAALFLGMPFVWYALGPDGWLFRIVVRLPGFRSVELPMHGWFLPALGLALLAGAGALRLPTVLRLGMIAATFVDLVYFNQLQLPLAYARQSFDELYARPLAAFEAHVQAAQPPVERLYGPAPAGVGYRNHALQSRVQTTYGYNPLELSRYAAYVQAAESNPRLIDGLAATHRLVDDSAVQPNTSALPLAYVARHVSFVADDDAAADRLIDLDPARDTLVVGEQALALDLDPAAFASVVERGDDWLTIHYRTASPGLLRIAVAYFPGWHAHVDGAEVPLLRADYAFIGVVVPPGETDLRLSYADELLPLGAAVSALALLTCLALLGTGRIPSPTAKRLLWPVELRRQTGRR